MVAVVVLFLVLVAVSKAVFGQPVRVAHACAGNDDGLNGSICLGLLAALEHCSLIETPSSAADHGDTPVAKTYQIRINDGADLEQGVIDVLSDREAVVKHLVPTAESAGYLCLGCKDHHVLAVDSECVAIDSETLEVVKKLDPDRFPLRS